MISRQFYELLTEISDDSSAAQITKLEKFVSSHPAFVPGASWLLDKYVHAAGLKRAGLFFTSLPNSGPLVHTKNWMLAKTYSIEGKSKKALEAFTSSFREGAVSPELALDFLLFDMRNFKKFEDVNYLAALAIDEEALEMMHALWDYLNYKWKQAIEKISSLTPEVQNNLTILYSWGYCLNRSGQNKLASEKWQRGLETARALGDLQFESKFLLGLGIIAETLQTQLFYFDSSYVIAKQIGELTWLEYLAGNRAIGYREQGQFSLADSLFRVAINAARQMQSPGSMSAWYPQYGNLLVRQDRFDEALKAYDTGAGIARKAGRIDVLLRCQIEAGELYRMLGQFVLARRALSRVYKAAQDSDWPLLERDVHIQIADLDVATGRYEEARRVYRIYLDTPLTSRHDLQDHTWWRIQTGRSYLAESNHKAARSEFSEAFALADSANYDLYAGLSLLYLAEIDLVENDLRRAHVRLDQCLTLSAQTEIDQVLPAIYSLRGNAYEKASELEKALHQYKKAASLIERTRENLASEASKLDYFGGKSDIYDKLVDCYREIYAATDIVAYRDSLYTYMEMKRGRTLRELQVGNGAESGDSDSNFRRDKLLQASKRLKSQQRYLRDYGALFTKQEMDSVMAQVQTARLSLIAQRLRLTQGTNLDSDSLLAKIPSLEKLNAILQANESALIFYHFSENPFALAITGDTTQVVSLPTTITSLDSSIQALLNPFHCVTEDAAEAVFKADLAHELFLILVAPIEDAVRLPENLLIAPDAHLANLPFELLLTAKPERSEYITAAPPTYSDDFLIQRYSIGYVPNASFLSDADFGAASKDVLVFADPFDEAPLMDRQMLTSLRTGLSFDPLIYASKEASGIKKIHAKTAIFRREKATKATLFQEAPKYDIVHFATHAFVDTTHDAFSGLVLSTSDDREDDGILMGYEITDLDLQADLVTLSACETGRGKVMPGEGVLGLPRLFLGAGANTVLMTHWKVDDRFAADFVVDFYDHYLKQGLPKARALAAAKRRVLSSPRKSGEVNYRHPFYWASFAMYGEPGFQRPAASMGFFLTALAALLIIFLLLGFSYRRWAHKFQSKVLER